jgi:rRNA maturation protein Nop10
MLKCPLCEHQQEAGEECENCGKRFQPSGLTADASAADAVSDDDLLLMPTAAGANPMLVCPHCQQPTAEVFCPNCGIRVRPHGFKMPAQPAELSATAPRAYTCPHCQQPTTETFCATCGVRVKPRSPEPEPEAAAEPERRACPSCGQWTVAATCPRCGVRMTTSAL